MATVAEFTIAADAIPLGKIFDDVPEITVELERVVPTKQAIVPYLWIRGAKIDNIEDVLGELSEVREIKLVDEIDEEYLIRLTWEEGYEGVLQAIAETDITLLSGTGSKDRWSFEVRGDDQAVISAFQQYCSVHDIPIKLTGLHSLSHTHSGGEFSITDAQREALILAYERGYFQTPRNASLSEIAEELGITGQSLGSRIRRGTHRLVGSTLIGS